MMTLFNIAVINALTVLPLAVLVWLVSRIARSPALTHALWIVVLLKLVTPPLFHLPVSISIPMAGQAQPPELSLPAESGLVETEGFQADAARTSSSVQEADLAVSDVAPGTSSRAEPALPVEVVSRSSPGGRGTEAGWLTSFGMPFVAMRQALSAWWTVLASVWLGGVILTFGIQGWLAIRFAHRVVAVASRDAELQQQARQLAKRMSLRSCPEVRVVAATVSPMLWSCGSRTTLLFPLALIGRLDTEARATLLIHELAHFGRGDHWVRWLELLATGLFWWHPVLWWARQQIEDSEEECCDAWVVHQFPQTPRRYAEALLDTIDFLCDAHTATPPLVSGLGNASVLRRRLTKIMCGVSPKSLSHRLRAGVGLLTAFLLPIQPFVFGSASKSPVVRPVFPFIEVSSFKPQPPNSGDQNSGDSQPSSDADSRTTSHPGTADPVTPSKSRSLRGERVWSTAVSPGGRFVVRATTGRRVVLTDLNSNRESDLSSHGITAVSFTPDGTQFVSVANDGRVLLWEPAASELMQVLYTHGDGLRSVSVSPHGDSVAVGGNDGTLLVLDLKTGETLTQLPRQTLPVNCVRFSPDASRLAVALGEWSSTAQGQVRLINLQTSASTVLECDSAPGAVTFVSNDELIVGQWNGHATLWNLIQRQIVGAATADKNIIAAASFSPDNPQLREIAFVSSGLSNE